MATLRACSWRNSIRVGGAILVAAFFSAESRGELVARYSFDETDGATVLADSGGTADGILNAVSFVSSGAGAVGSTGFGNAGVFNGVDGAVLFGFSEHPPSFDLGTDDFTIAGWLKAPLNEETGVPGNRTVFQNQSYAGGGWSFEIGRADRSYAGEIFFTVGGGNAATFSLTQTFSDARVDDDIWHWVAVTNNAGAISMYVDGALQADTGAIQEISTATPPPGTEASFAARAGSVFFEGELDEWSIYSHALTGTLNGGTSGVLTGGELFDLWQQGVVVTATPGDFDNDNDVDGRDFLLWQRGESSDPLSAEDLLDWQNNYGSGSSIASIYAVPEPSAWLLLSFGFAVLGRRSQG